MLLWLPKATGLVGVGLAMFDRFLGSGYHTAPATRTSPPGEGSVTMRLYAEVARRSFQRHLAYRAATLAGHFTNSVFGLLIASVYLALYRGHGKQRVAGFSASDLIAQIAARYQLHDVAIEEPETEEIVRRIYDEGTFIPGSSGVEDEGSATLPPSSMAPRSGQAAKETTL